MQDGLSHEVIVANSRMGNCRFWTELQCVAGYKGRRVGLTLLLGPVHTRVSPCKKWLVFRVALAL